jgi:hypothetical protein
MGSLYVWLKFFHIVGVGLFLFGHGVTAITSYAVRGRPADSTTAALLRASIGSAAIYYPGLILILVTGIWMGFVGSLWRTGWIWTALAVLVLTAMVMGIFSRHYHQARDAFAKPGQEAEAAANLSKTRPALLAVIGTAAIVVLLFLMVFKPF